MATKPMTPNTRIKIGQAAKMLGVTAETMRNWEKSGKLKPAEVSPGGTRFYMYGAIAKLIDPTFPELPSLMPTDPLHGFESLTRDERKAKLQDLADKIIILAEHNPAGFLDNQASLNKLLELASRADEKEERQEEKESPLARLSEANLRTAPTGLLYAALLDHIGQEFIRPERLDEFNALMVDKLLTIAARPR